MRALCLPGLVWLLACGGAVAQMWAPGAYDPPVASKAALEAALNPIPRATVARYVREVSAPHVYTVYQGKNAALRAQSFEATKTLRIGANFPVDLPSSTLFTDALRDGGYIVYLGAITSRDALGLRVCADLSKLAKGDEVWVIDPTAPRAFGPFTTSSDVRWLSSVEGDTAIIMARTRSTQVPNVDVVGVSHFYISMDEALKLLSCEVNIACESDVKLRDQVSTAVGRIAITTGNMTTLCSGALVNNADTPAYEPYFITANHCVSTSADARNSEVIWDYRSASCSPTTAPALSALPRSEGVQLLATDPTLDGTLIKLDNVPTGVNGRYYLGWELRAPVVGEPVICLHHPEATVMRVNHGRVLAINESVRLDSLTTYQKQTRVVWDSGVTEAGSSGSCLLFGDGSYALAGMLSNGTEQSCGADRSGNIDDFASFRDFYPEVAGYLSGTTPPVTTAATCPAKAVFQNNLPALQDLRAFRDQVLMRNAIGKELVAAYYRAAPYMVKLVQQSSEARRVFAMTARPFIAVGEHLRGRALHAARSK